MSPTPSQNPVLQGTSAISTGTNQRPRQLSFYEILALVRLELILLLLCVGQAARLFLIFPMRAQAMKEIFMGMKVALDRSTVIVLTYSDLISAYPFLALIVVGLLLAALLGGVRWLGDSANRASRQGNEPLARFQVTATVTLTMTLIILLTLSAYAEHAVNAPMLKLVNAID